MTLPTKEILETTLLAIPPISTPDYSKIAKWITDNTNNKMWLTNILPNTSTVFTFNEAVFISNLLNLTPTANLNTAATSFFTALEVAIIGSVFLVLPGASIGSTPTPANTWSAVATTLPDPDSLNKAKDDAILYMSNTEYSLTAPTLANSVRIYLTSLTYTITGTSGVATPLIAPKVKVL